jgi:hypothetical protein
MAEASAHVAAAEGDPARARDLLTAAADLFERAGQPLDLARARRGLVVGSAKI